jgi:hypothetical protein
VLLFIEIGLYVAGSLIMFLSVAANYIVFLEIALLAMGSAGAIRLVKTLVQPSQHWSTCSILAGMGVVSYFLGAFITLVQYDPSSTDLELMVGNNFIPKAALAAGYISLFYWTLVALSMIEHRFWRDALTGLKMANSFSIDGTTALVTSIYLAVISMSELVLIFTGQWTLGGLNPTEANTLPIGATVVWYFSLGIPSIAGWVIGKWQRPYQLIMLACISAIVQIPWLSSVGRRSIVFSAVAFLTAYYWAHGRKHVLRTAVLGLPIALIVYFATKLIVAARYVGLAYSDESGNIAISISNLFTQGYNLISSDPDLVANLEIDSYRSRFFIFNYLTTVVSDLSWSGAKYGLYLFIAAVNNVPSLFYPGKTALLIQNDWGADGKSLMNQALGLVQFDAPWSPFVAGYGDFMWFGALIYPAIFLLLGLIFSRIMKGVHNPVMVIAGFGICLRQYLEGETSITGFFLVVRMLIFLWIIAKIVDLWYQSPKGAGKLVRTE